MFCLTINFFVGCRVETQGRGYYMLTFAAYYMYTYIYFVSNRITKPFLRLHRSPYGISSRCFFFRFWLCFYFVVVGVVVALHKFTFRVSSICETVFQSFSLLSDVVLPWFNKFFGCSAMQTNKTHTHMQKEINTVQLPVLRAQATKTEMHQLTQYQTYFIFCKYKRKEIMKKDRYNVCLCVCVWNENSKLFKLDAFQTICVHFFFVPQNSVVCLFRLLLLHFSCFVAKQFFSSTTTTTNIRERRKKKR